MNLLKLIYRKSKKAVKFSVTDPSSFEELMSFVSSRIRVFSLTVLVFIVFGISILFLFDGVFNKYSGSNDTPIEREQLIEYRESIDTLKDILASQERYIRAQTRIISGEFPLNTDLDSIEMEFEFPLEQDVSELSKAERELAERVKDDMRTVKIDASIPYFQRPVVGVISQHFSQNHPGVDVVTEKDHTVKSCLSGTVIYSGYTRKDGYILIIDHGNDYTSIYKHNRKALKKIGDKVQLGDPIAIVGSTGQNSDGPHLHFELWYKQVPVNPEEYLQFNR
ncbi:M23 family metallopeptidase [Crocinitomicaceae bacterium]|nr:M23 family metallopeptidase [Crocinitomicaceae bacterium]